MTDRRHVARWDPSWPVCQRVDTTTTDRQSVPFPGRPANQLGARTSFKHIDRILLEFGKVWPGLLSLSLLYVSFPSGGHMKAVANSHYLPRTLLAKLILLPQLRLCGKNTTIRMERTDSQTSDLVVGLAQTLPTESLSTGTREERRVFL